MILFRQTGWQTGAIIHKTIADDLPML